MRILLATEGSEFSQAALDKCCDIFRSVKDVEILILSVADPVFVPVGPFSVSAAYSAEADQAVMEIATQAVTIAEKELRRVFSELGTPLTTKVVKGRPAQAIVEEAENWGADLIVLGSHGYGFWQRTFLGSVSSAVVHHAPCSVLIVRPSDEYGQNGSRSHE